MRFDVLSPPPTWLSWTLLFASALFIMVNVRGARAGTEEPNPIAGVDRLVDAGTTDVGTTTSSDLPIVNASSSAVSVAAWLTVDGDAGEFEIVGDSVFALGAGESDTLRLAFSPIEPGVRSARIFWSVEGSYVVPVDVVAIGRTTDGAMDVVFRLFEREVDTGRETLRWIGTAADGPFCFGSRCPQTERPIIGFGRSFRIAWECVAGDPIGYQFNASQDATEDAAFLPRDGSGIPVFGQVTDFTFGNHVAPGDSGSCDTPWPDCPDASRFESGSYSLRLKARDTSGAELESADGTLSFDVNYPPESAFVFDGVYPRWESGDASGVFAEGDTIPSGSTVFYRQAGFDRRLSSADRLPDGTACCDEVLDEFAPEVRFQTRIAELAVRDEETHRLVATPFAAPVDLDVGQLEVGPFDYRLEGRSVDELGRRDPSAASFGFHVGFTPRVTQTIPAEGDSVVLRFLGGEPWAENDVAYTYEFEQRYWDPAMLEFFEEDGPGRVPHDGFAYRYDVRLMGEADVRDPDSVGSWAYSLVHERDPENRWKDGPGADRLDVWSDGTADDVWDFTASERTAEVWIPLEVLLGPAPQSGGHDRAEYLATWTARRLGSMQLTARARIGRRSDAHQLSGPDGSSLTVLGSGRASPEFVSDYTVTLGLDPQSTGAIVEFWPPPDFDLDPPRIVDFDDRDIVLDLAFGEELNDDVVLGPDDFRIFVTDDPVTRSDVTSVDRVGPRSLRLTFAEALLPSAAYTIAHRSIRDVFGNGSHDWSFDAFYTGVTGTDDVPRAQRATLGPPRPNPFNPRTTFDFTTARAGEAILTVYAASGRRVVELFRGVLPAGSHQKTWDGLAEDGHPVASGVYYVQLRTPFAKAVRKAVVVR